MAGLLASLAGVNALVLGIGLDPALWFRHVLAAAGGLAALAGLYAISRFRKQVHHLIADPLSLALFILGIGTIAAAGIFLHPKLIGHPTGTGIIFIAASAALRAPKKVW